MSKVIIAGPRTLTDFTFVCGLVHSNIDIEKSELVCGMAKGVDTIGYEMFKTCKRPIHKFIPDWDKLGKGAGVVRNKEMGDFADKAIVFWDGKSTGSKHMYEYMLSLNKPVILIKYVTHHMFKIRNTIMSARLVGFWNISGTQMSAVDFDSIRLILKNFYLINKPFLKDHYENFAEFEKVEVQYSEFHMLDTIEIKNKQIKK